MTIKYLDKIKNRLLYGRSRTLEEGKKRLSGKSGLEIGGPSGIFTKKGVYPVYQFVHELDNSNYSSYTLWQNNSNQQALSFEGKLYKKNMILEATNLDEIVDQQYDFILASHVLEHTANPIKALLEWRRIIKENGTMLVILPHKNGTFDHNREITPLEHMISDYNDGQGEDDLTHLPEILQKHDLSLDPAAGSFENFKERSLDNLKHRALHHHTFNTYSAIQLLDYIKVKILTVEVVLPFNIILLATKQYDHDNSSIMDFILSNRFKTPFKSDKLKFII